MLRIEETLFFKNFFDIFDYLDKHGGQEIKISHEEEKYQDDLHYKVVIKYN